MSETYEDITAQVFPVGPSFAQRVKQLLTAEKLTAPAKPKKQVKATSEMTLEERMAQLQSFVNIGGSGTNTSESAFITTVLDLIGPNNMDEKWLEGSFRIHKNGGHEILHIYPQDNFAESAVLMRLWLIDYMVEKSHQMPKAMRGVEWYNLMYNNFYLLDHDYMMKHPVNGAELELLFIPVEGDVAEFHNREITFSALNTNFGVYRSPLQLLQVVPAPERDIEVSASKDQDPDQASVLEKMTPPERQDYLKKLRNTRYKVYGYCRELCNKRLSADHGQIQRVNQTEFLQGWGFPFCVTNGMRYSGIEYTKSSRGFEKLIEENDAECRRFSSYFADERKYKVVVDDNEISPFKPFFGMLFEVNNLCKRMGFDQAFSPYEFMERTYIYQHSFATGDAKFTPVVTKANATPETDAITAHFKLRSDVIYGETTCPALINHYYTTSLRNMINNEGKCFGSAEVNAMALLLRAGATAGFCVFPIEAVRQNFVDQNVSESVKAAFAAEAEAAAASKTKSRKKKTMDEQEAALLIDWDLQGDYKKEVSLLAQNIGKFISDKSFGEVKYVGHARSLKYLYVDFLIFDSSLFKAAIAAFKDSDLAQENGLTSCSFQTFSRSAHIYHFYGEELQLDPSTTF